MNWASIIQALKDLTGARFYFIAVLAFLLIVGSLFKDTIDIAIKDVSFSKVEFRDTRDMKGLEVALGRIKQADSVIKSFTVYIYQPKERSYYKKLLITDDEIVKSTVALQGSYLEDQPTINTVFETKKYLMIDETVHNADIAFMKDLGFDNVLVYKLESKTTIGEIHLNFYRRPTQEELNKILKQLAPLVYVYVI